MNRTRRDEPISHRVVAAVAERAEVEPIDLPPLYDTIDPDALDTIVEHGGENLTISFSFAGYDVGIDEEERVHVE